MRSHERGQTIVEFAVVSILFFMILFVTIDFAMMFYVNQTMQHAVRAGARQAVVTSQWNCDAIIPSIRAQSMGYYDKNAAASKDPVISRQTLGAWADVAGTPVTGAGCGTPQQPITVSLTYSWPLLSPFLRPLFTNGMYTFTVKATVVNEPKA